MSSLMGNARLIFQQIRDRTGITKSRRSLFLLILGATTAFYILSQWIPRRRTHANIEYNPCLQAKLDEYIQDQRNMDVIINHQPLYYGETSSLAFTGNGYLGLSFSTESDIQLITDVDSSFISSSYSPTAQISADLWEDSHALLLHLKKGFIEKTQCFQMNNEHSAHVVHRLYAHRTRPSLIVQDIEVVNPSEQTFEFHVRRNKPRLRSNLKQLNKQEIEIGAKKDAFLMTTFQLTLRQHHSLILVIVTNKVISMDPVNPSSSSQQLILTVTKYSPIFRDEVLQNGSFSKEWEGKLEQQAKDELIDVSTISSRKLFEEHKESWASIWTSGFSISRSLAPGTLNGDVINRTIYYVLSSTPSPLYDVKLDQNKRKEFNQSLFSIDRCYESHSTLLGERLWRSPGDDLAISQLSTLWRSTLTKRGCSTLMLSGVNGVLQSILLSIGGIRFRNHHLEMFLDPKELHRDLFFRSINFGKQYYLNISITVGHDNRAVIDVSIDQENGQAYACDAGCIDPPTKLKNSYVRFPVKMTDPPTAILYVTEDFHYMTELKDTLHVKEVAMAPPHAHEVLALHRHGHKLGGLPVIFWVALAFLIVIFHLFLLKIVLNEMGFVKQTLPSYNTRTRAH